MAEAVGLGASVLAFIKVFGQLSTAAITCYDSIKDAPEDIARVRERLRDLERILAEIGRVRSIFPIGEHDDPGTQRYWNDKCRGVRSHFDGLTELANGWNASARSGTRRYQWILSNRARAEKSLVKLSEDIETLKSLHHIMMVS